MLSITGLLFILKFVTIPAFIPVDHETVIRQYLPSEDRNNFYSGYQLIDQALKKKKIIHINLTGDDTEDDKKIIFIQSEARRLKYTCDTTKLIEIHLSDQISYGRYVELVNMMLKDQHRRYALWKNNFYIFGENPPTNISVGTGKQIKPFFL
ncbi:MAG: hypothetical protein ABIR15_03220 [Chitinophagaceae bacterium]